MVRRNKKNLIRKFGIVIPLANEEKSIKRLTGELIKELDLLKVKFSIYFVIDKASKDRTKEKVEGLVKKNKNISLLYRPQNRNVVDAYLAGFKKAIIDKCDGIVEMDAGFSHLPKEIYKFINGLNQGYDCVFGVRPLASKDYKVPLHRRLLSLGGSILSKHLLGIKLPDVTSGYEAFRGEKLKKIIKVPLMSINHSWHIEIKYRSRKFNNKAVTITYNSPSNRVSYRIILNSFNVLVRLIMSKFIGLRND